MRSLKKEEMKTLFEKLAHYVGSNAEVLVSRDDEAHCFRIIKNKVYYFPSRLLNQAQVFHRKNLMGAGICLGKMTHSGQFHVLISALPFLAQLSPYRVWVSGAGELAYVYRSHVIKRHVIRMSDDIPANA
ncbi:hypothetical protein KIPB_007087, partial [Kipferlia bialata]|eukprot:g7087.t1